MSDADSRHSGAAPESSDPTADAFELPVKPFEGTPEEIERQWFEQVYTGRGDSMAQLTWRAVLMGSALGGVLSLTNLYIGLKAGWAFGVAITACILSYAIWTTLYKIGLARTPMTILENNCMQSTASSAGYSTGGTLVSAFSAYIMLNGEPLPTPLMLAWVFFLAVLGVTMAVPMKRQMVNIEQLPFPSGLAAAETLKALHSHGGKGIRAARALGIAGVLAALDKFWLEGLPALGGALKAPFLALLSTSTWIDKFNLAVIGKAWIDRTVLFAWDPIFIAAGAIIGMRVCASILLGSVTCWMIFVPIMQDQGVITGAGFRDIVQWTLWGGTSCMVSSGILSFALQWKSAVRAFRGLGRMISRDTTGKDDQLDAIETPGAWFVIGQLVSLVALAWLAKTTFGMPIWQSALAVLLSFGLALVACRVTGETDTTPTGAMGKIMQLTFGVVHPARIPGDMAAMNVNLMAANITAGAAGSSADLLTDLKSGYLLGAHPRKQFLAQFAGIFVGTVVTVFAYQLMVPRAEVLGSDQFPAPAAQTWKAVAEALSAGLDALEPVKVWSIIIGGAVGIILPLLSVWLPKCRAWIPSPAGIGLAWVFHWYYGLLFFTGAVVGLIFKRVAPKAAEEYTFPIASGIIAGNALMGVAIVLAENGPDMFRKLFLGGGG